MNTTTKNSIRVLAVYLSICLPLFISGTSAIRFNGHSSHKIDVTLPSDIPTALAPPPATVLVGAYMGVGYQQYTYNGSLWVNTNVTSYLLDKNGVDIGHHQYVTMAPEPAPLPNWTSFNNFSSATGRNVAEVPQHSALPLALIKGIFSYGDAMYFGRTAYVQMLKTSGGLPPNARKNPTSGHVFNSKYSALYAFYAYSEDAATWNGGMDVPMSPAPAPMSSSS